MPTYIEDFLPDLLLRETTRPGIAAKGLELEYAELDRNIYAMAEFVHSVAYAAIARLPAYDSAAIYTGGVEVDVSYSGLAYTFISVTNRTGVTPGTNDAVWLKAPISKFAHLGNGDTQLIRTGGIALTADQIYAGLNASGPFSPLRTVSSNPAIGPSEVRLPYDCADGDITPAMPAATNGRPLKFYNDGTINDIIVSNVRLVDGSIDTFNVTPGNVLRLVGNGTNWRFD